MTDLSQYQHLLDFTPVPSASNRRDGWTPGRQRLFIIALGELGSVAAAAKIVDMTRQSANRLRHRPGAESFAAAWDAAIEEGVIRQFDQAIDTAKNGRLVPVRCRGEVIAHRRVFNNRLLYAACYAQPPRDW